jgi:hypothetical protein
MTDEPDSSGMIGRSPTERGLAAVPADPGDHAVQSAREWQDVAESFERLDESPRFGPSRPDLR